MELIIPLGPNVMPVSTEDVVAAPEVSAVVGAVVGVVSPTTTVVLVETTIVVTLLLDVGAPDTGGRTPEVLPVPAALPLGKIPFEPVSEGSIPKISLIDRLVDEVSCRVVRDPVVAGVVRGTLPFFQTWRLTCRGK